MRTAKLFLDGHHDEHDVGIGARLVLRRSEESLTILGLARNPVQPPTRPAASGGSERDPSAREAAQKAGQNAAKRDPRAPNAMRSRNVTHP